MKFDGASVRVDWGEAVVDQVLPCSPGVSPVRAKNHLFPAMQAANYRCLPLDFIGVQIYARHPQMLGDYNRRHVRDRFIAGELCDDWLPEFSMKLPDVMGDGGRRRADIFLISVFMRQDHVGISQLFFGCRRYYPAETAMQDLPDNIHEFSLFEGTRLC